MAVSDDRKFTRAQVYALLEGIKGLTLGEVDSSGQFVRAQKSSKITGSAGDVIEQSVFGYARDSRQECDIEIDGVLTELKTTGVRIPKKDLSKAIGKVGNEYNLYLGAKEGISITGVTFDPEIQLDFFSSHFWEKSEHLLIVFYEYRSYDIVPASGYKHFPVVGYCYNTFSEVEVSQLRHDWEIVRDYLKQVYAVSADTNDRNEHLQGFTHILRPELLLIELVPGFKKKVTGAYQKPRYRLKQTFVDYIVRGHFNKKRAKHEINLREPFSSFAELDERCRALTKLYGGKSLGQLMREFDITSKRPIKNLSALCIIKMFGADCNRLNLIADFTKAGIIAKTITLKPDGKRTEDMKLNRIDFEEWTDRDRDFEESDIYVYFCEHSFLCPVFCEHDSSDCLKTTFEGFKRFAFDEVFLEKEVRRVWEDSRNLIYRNELRWIYNLSPSGEYVKNKSGSYKGAPNFPKSSDYTVFFRGGNLDSSERERTECVNGINMLPQYYWLKGSFIATKLKSLPFL